MVRGSLCALLAGISLLAVAAFNLGLGAQGVSAGSMDPMQPTPMEKDALLGDADCDGAIGAVDAAVVLQLDAAFIDAPPCDAFPDVNCDMALDAVDASLILQYSAGLVLYLPV